MKSSKLAFALTALFTNYACDAVHVVSVKTESIMKDSQWGLRIQKSIMSEQERLTQPLEKLEAEVKEKNMKFVEKQKALEKEDQNFKNQAPLLSPDARADKYEELQKKHRDLEEEFVDFQRAVKKGEEDAKKVNQKLEAFYRKEMMAFEQEIKNLIEQVAHAEGWDIVLAKESLIYAGPTTDKTSLVIKKLDEQEEKRNATAKAVNSIKK